MTSTLKKLWKNEYVQTAIVISLIVLVVVGFWYGAQLVLNTSAPVLVVVSGSMCIPYDGNCDGWSDPFTRTLHIGDLIIVQGVNPADLNGNYPSSDIIVFHQPGNPEELIVHRIVAVDKVNGTLYFRTKGDGNPDDKWPNPLQPLEYDPWAIPPAPGVSQDMVVGKVVMRIPLIGNVVLFLRTPAGIISIVTIAAILVIIEFILPVFRKKPTTALSEPQKN